MYRGLLTTGALLFLLFPGCDQLKESVQQPEGPPPAPVAEPVATPEPPVVMAAPKSPQDVINAFMALPHFEITDEKFRELTSLPEGLEQITALDLSVSQITDVSFDGIAKFPQLTSLVISQTRLTNAAFTHLEGLTQLEALSAEKMPQIDGNVVQSLLRIPSLKAVKLSESVVGDDAVAALGDLPHLEVLHLNGVRNMTGGSFAAACKAGKFPVLRELAFSNTQFGSYGLINVGSLKSLEIISASHADLNDGGFKTIGNCSNLRVLNIQGNSFGPEAIKQLPRLKNLETLRLDDCPVVVDAAFDILKNMKQLKELGLEGCNCTPGAVDQLKSKFLKSTTIFYGGKQL